jgi:hypothetical protein
VHNGRPFHPVNNPIEYGTPFNQFTQHPSTNRGDLDPLYIAPNSSGQVRTVFQADDEERTGPEMIELGVIALVQANVTLNSRVTVPMPKSFYDRNGIEQDYGEKFPTIYFGLAINTELRLIYNAGCVQVTDTCVDTNSRTVDIGGISLIAVLMTSHIYPRLILLDNIPHHYPTIKLAFPCAKYGGGPNSGLRVAHIVQEMGYIKELGIIGSGDNHKWENNARVAATAHGVAQFASNIALVPGEDSALPSSITDED